MSNLSTNALKARRGCEGCRGQHLRCDLARPKCSRCQSAGIDCNRDLDVRFKHTTNAGVELVGEDDPRKAEFNFGHAQRWVDTNGELRFLDETRELMSLYDHELPNGVPETTTPWTRYTSSIDAVFASGGTQNDGTSATRVGDFQSITSAQPNEDGAELIASPSKRRRVTVLGEDSAVTPSNVDRSPTASWRASYALVSATGSPQVQSGDLDEDSVISKVQSRPSALHHSTSFSTSFSPATEFSWRPSSSHHHDESEYVTSPDTPGRLYLKTPVWPLEKIEEARLLRHFVENLARSFDLTDPDRHFRVIVPQRAGTCPTLLNAIFALSARHLSRIGDYDPLISDRYHQECLKHLIPMLDDSTAVLDENLLASTIILRHLEELQVPLSAQGGESHLLGAHIFLEAQVRATLAGGLREAAFWVGLRQEIFVAFVNQRSIMPAIERNDVDRTFENAPDHVWSCRMVLLCADVIRHCFSDNDHPTRTYRELVDSVTEWYRRKPASFTPLYYEDASGDNVFPTAYFLRDEITLGLQHYHIAQILLSAHNPKVPRIGPGRAAALRQMDEDIKAHVKILCGMCQSNEHIAPNHSYAAMAITIAGDKFTDVSERNALLQLLDICEKRHAHPTGRARDNLRTAWGWA